MGIVVFSKSNSPKLTLEDSRGKKWRHGGLPHCIYFRPYRKREIVGHLKIRNSRIRFSKCCFCTLYYCALKDQWM